MELTLAQLQELGSPGFPGLLGIDVYEAGDGFVRARLELHEKHQAPNGYLHAGAVVGLADSACGYGCILGLPEGATGFTTIERAAELEEAAAARVVRELRAEIEDPTIGRCRVCGARTAPWASLCDRCFMARGDRSGRR